MLFGVQVSVVYVINRVLKKKFCSNSQTCKKIPKAHLFYLWGGEIQIVSHITECFSLKHLLSVYQLIMMEKHQITRLFQSKH